MQDERRAIRSLIESFQRASETGDLETALALIAADAVFLVSGPGTMDRETYATAATATSDELDFELSTKIGEIRVFGECAWTHVKFELTMTPRNGDPAKRLTGDTLTVLEKRAGRWLVVRGADTMVEAEASPAAAVRSGK